MNKIRLAVIGNPVKHSKSPEIHSHFAKETGMDISYEAICCSDFKKLIRELISKGYKGVNVTIPFKEEAMNLADFASDEARLAGAANTLLFQDGKILAYNTDGTGLIKDIQKSLNLENKNLLLIGAGGAAKGIAMSLINNGISSLTILNRTLNKAQNLKLALEKFGFSRVRAFDFPTFRESEPFEVILNSTSTSLQNQRLDLDDWVFNDTELIYDLFYSPERTRFLKDSLDSVHGKQVILLDGLGMLIEQAALSFQIWTGTYPHTETLHRTLTRNSNGVP